MLLAVTNSITQGPIADAARAAADAARKQVLSSAEAFEQLETPEGGAVDALYQGKAGDEIVGYTATATTQGSQGPVEVTVGVDTHGAITGISVGGSKFAETAGLGTECQEPDFTNQFIGLQAPIALGDGVDAISGATVTSKAVVAGVNAACEATGALTDATSAATKEEDATSAATKEEDVTTAATQEQKKEEK